MTLRFLPCFLMLLTAPLTGQSYFLSDGLGHELAPFESLSGSEKWYLSVRQEDSREIRTLFKEQAELKRWEISRPEEEGLSLIENYFYKNKLREIREYDGGGFLLSEQMYDSEGGLMEYRQYLPDEKNRPSRIIILDEQGAQEISYRFLYRDNGSLRSISGETPSGGIEKSILWRSSEPGSFLDRIYLKEGKSAYRYDYREGQLQVRLIYRDNVEIEKTLYTFDSGGRTEKTTNWDHRKKSMAVIYFNNEGQPVLENRFLGGILAKIITRSYKGELLIQLQEYTDTEKQAWEYEYREGSQSPSVSRLYRNDSLVKAVFHDESPVREVLYRNNEAVYEKLLEGNSEGGAP